MDTQAREKLESRPFSESPKGPEKQTERPSDKNVKEKASELLQSDTVEAAEGQEGAEMADGKVSEMAAEDKAKASQGGAKKKYSDDEIEAIRAKLLAALPSQAMMVKQIRKKLQREEKVLVKRMKKLQKKSHVNAFQLTIVVAQLRKVREYFFLLAHATFEMVKHLWLKIVHGV